MRYHGVGEPQTVKCASRGGPGFALANGILPEDENTEASLDF